MKAAALSAKTGEAAHSAPVTVAFMVISKEQVGREYPKSRFKRRYRRYINAGQSVEDLTGQRRVRWRL